MPITAPTTPGVHIREAPSGVRPIVGVSTSTAAFVGSAKRGPLAPVHIQSFADYERDFGGLSLDSTMSYAVQHFFLNGGTDAIIVRVHHPSAVGADDQATIDLGALTLEAATRGEPNPGTWGNNLRAKVDDDTRDKDLAPDEQDPRLFNLIIEETVTLAPGTDPLVVRSETFLNVSTDQNSNRFVSNVLSQESTLVGVRGDIPQTPPPNAPDPTTVPASGGDNGLPIEDPDLTSDQGLFALQKTDDLFNLLCIPPLDRERDITDPTRTEAAKFCGVKRAMFIVDPPSGWRDATAAATGVDDLRRPLGANMINAALYFPRVMMPDALRENRLQEFAPCGVVAGIMARTDAQRGVFKAPAGQEATLAGVSELTVKLTDGDQGRLNPLGVNCLRTFPVVGHVVWGARTLRGADRMQSDSKYVSVRRMILFIEESLYQGTQFAVFEPNGPALWDTLRLNIEAFLQNLFRQGAFFGRSAREAYFVKVDEETTTQADIDQGIVNILVGVALLKPAEFVIITIQQIQQVVGQAQA